MTRNARSRLRYLLISAFKALIWRRGYHPHSGLVSAYLRDLCMPIFSPVVNIIQLPNHHRRRHGRYSSAHTLIHFLRSHRQHPSRHLLYLLWCCSYSHLRPSCWYTVAYSDDFLRLFPKYVHCNVSKQDTTYTKRYDTRCYINVRSKANMSQLNLPPGNDN